MDLRKGKTIKKYSMHIPQDSLLSVSFDEDKRKSISLFGYDFRSYVMYSLKKKNRWRLSTLLSKEEYEEEQPITYSRHQCIDDRNPLLDVYLYDSISAKEMGRKFISNKSLARGFNCESTIYNLENINNYTKKEIELFEKSKRVGNKKRKLSRKHHKPERVFIPDEFEELPRKNEYEIDKEKRIDCVRIKEYVHINNLTTVSCRFPYNVSKNTDTKKKVNSLKNEGKNSIDAMLKEDIDCNEEYESQYLSENEEEKSHMLKFEDCIVNNIRVSKKRRLKRKEVISRKFYIEEKKSKFVESGVDSDKSVIDLHENVLPCLNIETSINVFLEDVRRIMRVFRCYVNNTRPSMILIDLDEYVELRSKNLILLQSAISSREGILTVNVVFNISYSKFDFNEVFDQRFESVQSLIVYVQSRLKNTDAKRFSQSSQIILLDSKLEGLTNVWKVKECDISKHIYSFHNEWRDHELNEETWVKFCEMFPNKITYFAECQVCFGDMLDNSFVTIRDCGHVVCTDCLSSHIVCRLETGMTDMICPGNDCDKMLDICLILSLISWRRYYKRLGILETYIISKSGCCCPYCGVVLMDVMDHSNGDKKQLQYQCICGRNVCSRCSQRQHFPSSCQEVTNYVMKMRDLHDIDIVPKKNQPLVYSGRPCPKCFNFVVKDGGCNHLTCHCGMNFCWGCGDPVGVGKHSFSSFPCFRVSDLVTQDFTKRLAIPDPSSIRPKLYCMALYYKVIMNDSHYRLFYQQLQSILNVDNFSFSKTEIQSQLTELTMVIEHTFVKAYQVNRRKQVNLLRYLKSNLSLFLFYEKLIEDIVDSIHNNINVLNFRLRSKKNLNSKFQRLVNLTKEVHFHLNRFSKALQ